MDAESVARGADIVFERTPRPLSSWGKTLEGGLDRYENTITQVVPAFDPSRMLHALYCLMVRYQTLEPLLLKASARDICFVDADFETVGVAPEEHPRTIFIVVSLGF